MKRSEMLEIIVDELEESYGEIRSTAIYTAESILDRIEEAGMLPPMKEYDFTTDEIRDLSWEKE